MLAKSKYLTKRLLSLILALVMAVSATSVSLVAYAQESSESERRAELIKEEVGDILLDSLGEGDIEDIIRVLSDFFFKNSTAKANKKSVITGIYKSEFGYSESDAEYLYSTYSKLGFYDYLEDDYADLDFYTLYDFCLENKDSDNRKVRNYANDTLDRLNEIFARHLNVYDEFFDSDTGEVIGSDVVKNYKEIVEHGLSLDEATLFDLENYEIDGTPLKDIDCMEAGCAYKIAYDNMFFDFEGSPVTIDNIAADIYYTYNYRYADAVLYLMIANIGGADVKYNGETITVENYKDVIGDSMSYADFCRTYDFEQDERSESAYDAYCLNEVYNTIFDGSTIASGYDDAGEFASPYYRYFALGALEALEEYDSKKYDSAEEFVESQMITDEQIIDLYNYIQNGGSFNDFISGDNCTFSTYVKNFLSEFLFDGSQASMMIDYNLITCANEDEAVEMFKDLRVADKYDKYGIGYDIGDEIMLFYIDDSYPSDNSPSFFSIVGEMLPSVIVKELAGQTESSYGFPGTANIKYFAQDKCVGKLIGDDALNEYAYRYGEFDIPEELVVYFINAKLNEFNEALINPNSSYYEMLTQGYLNMYNSSFTSEYDLYNAFKDIWVELYENPEEKYSEVKYTLEGVLKDFIIPACLDDTEGNEKFRDRVFDASRKVALEYLKTELPDYEDKNHCDLNTCLPAALNWILGNDYAAEDFEPYRFYDEQGEEIEEDTIRFFDHYEFDRMVYELRQKNEDENIAAFVESFRDAVNTYLYDENGESRGNDLNDVCDSIPQIIEILTRMAIDEGGVESDFVFDTEGAEAALRAIKEVKTLNELTETFENQYENYQKALSIIFAGNENTSILKSLRSYFGIQGNNLSRREAMLEKYESYCAELFSLELDSEIPAWEEHEHIYVQRVVEPTCTRSGYTEYTCSICHDTYRADITPKLAHTIVEDEAVAPNCTETGLTKGYHCSVCGEVILEQKEIPASHTDENSDGICDLCATILSDILPGETKTVKIASNVVTYLKFTPSLSGNYTFYSQSSSDTYGYLFDADKNQLTFDDDSGSNNNFSITYDLEKGKTYYFGCRYYTSSNSGSYDVTLVANSYACDHDFEVEIVEPTCQSRGYTRYTCTICGESYDDNFTPALSHLLEDNICVYCGGEYYQLHLDEYTTVRDVEGTNLKYLFFTPETSGTYYFYSHANGDSYGYLYDENMHTLTYNDDDAGDRNFLIEYTLEAGETYYIGARFYSDDYSGDIAVCVSTEKNFGHVFHLNHTEPDDYRPGMDEYICDICGYSYEAGYCYPTLSEGETKYFTINGWYGRGLKYGITPEVSGTYVVTINGWHSDPRIVEYVGDGYDDYESTVSTTNRVNGITYVQAELEAGRNYYFMTDGEYEGHYDYELSLRMLSDADIVDSVEASSEDSQPFELVENTWGYESYDYENNPFFCYNKLYPAAFAHFSYTVSYRDGHSEVFVYDTYERELVCEESGRRITLGFDDETGAYHFSTDSQYETPWKLGETNNAQVWAYMDGASICISIPIRIVETPVESIEFAPANPVVFREYSDGYVNTENEESHFQYYYNFATGDVINVLMKDGTEAQLEFYEDEDFGYGWYSENELLAGYKPYDNSYESQMEKPWLSGESNSFDISFMNVETSVDVEIIGISDIVYNRGKGITLFEEYDGYWDEDENQQQYYHYNPSVNNFNYGDELTVYYEDGEEIWLRLDYGDSYRWFVSDWFENGGRIEYSLKNFSFVTNQEEEHWQPGNRYIATLKFIDKDIPVEIFIKPDDVKSIDYIPAQEVSFYESQGRSIWYQNSETYVWSEINYFEYSVPKENDRVIITYLDNNVEEYTYVENYTDYHNGGFRTKDGKTLGDWWTTDTQEYGEWTPSGENYINFNFRNHTAQIPVTIKEDNAQNIEFVPVQPIKLYEHLNADIRTSGRWNDDTGEYESVLKEYYDFSFTNGDKLVVENKDGSESEITYFDTDDKCGWYDENGKYVSNEISENIYDSQKESLWKRTKENSFTIYYQNCSVDVPVEIVGAENISFAQSGPITIMEGNYETWNWDEYLEEEIPAYYISPECLSPQDELVITYEDSKQLSLKFTKGFSESFFETYDEETQKYFSISTRCFEMTNNQYEEEWQGDNTYTVYLSFADYSFDVDVYIQTDEIQDIEYVCANPIEINKESYSHKDGEDDGYNYYEWYTYYVRDVPDEDDKLIIYFKDGSSKEYNARYVRNRGTTFVDEDGEVLEYDFQCCSEFSISSDEFDSIEGDYIYNLEFKIGLHTAYIPVTIKVDKFSNIEYIPVGPYNIYTDEAYTSYRYDEDDNEFEYLRYNVRIRKGDVIRLTTNDGDVKKYTASRDSDTFDDYLDGLFVDDEGNALHCDIGIYSDQSSDPWTPDKENYFEVSVDGYRIRVDVNIIDAEVTAIRVNTAKEYVFKEGQQGTEPFVRSDGEKLILYPVSPENGDEITISRSDGSEITYTYHEYNEGSWYSVWSNEDGQVLGKSVGWGYYDDQIENPLVLGDNEIVIRYGDASCTVPVTITESDVLSVEPIGNTTFDIIENTCGWKESYEDEEHPERAGKYFYDPYEIILGNNVSFKVNYKDGSSKILTIPNERNNWCLLDEDGKEYLTGYKSYSELDGWGLGYNEFELTILGKTLTLGANIVESPYVSMSYVPVKDIVFKSGTDFRYNDDIYISAWDCFRAGDKLYLTKSDGSVDEYTVHIETKPNAHEGYQVISIVNSEGKNIYGDIYADIYFDEDGIVLEYSYAGVSSLYNIQTVDVCEGGHKFVRVSRDDFYSLPQCSVCGTVDFSDADANEIEFESVTKLSIPANGYRIMKFIPEKDGFYDVSAVKKDKTYGYVRLFNSDGRSFHSVTFGDDYNSSVNHYLNEGETYYVVVDIFSSLPKNVSIKISEKDSTALDAAIAMRDVLNEAEYTEDSFERFEDAIDESFSRAKFEASQEAIDRATQEILSAMYDLWPIFDLGVEAGEGGSIKITAGDNEYERFASIGKGIFVTLEAECDEGYSFKGWYETTSKRFVSDNPFYTFSMSSNTSLIAVFAKRGEASLTFANASGQICSTVTKTIDEWSSVTSLSELAPKVPFSYGRTNGRWVIPERALDDLQHGHAVVVTPEYDEIEGALDIDMPVATDGPAAHMIYAYDSDKKIGSFILTLDIPEDCTVDEIGTAFYYKKADEFNPGDFTLTLNNQMLVSKFTDKESGVYTSNMHKLDSRYNWAVRGYVTYRDRNDEIKTVYSNQINIVDTNQV